MQSENIDDRPEAKELLNQLQARLPQLEKLLAKCSDHWGHEDPIYRFYHRSFKVYKLQLRTLEIVQMLQGLAPQRPLNDRFMQIVQDGTCKTFTMSANRNWLPITRPILETFFHVHLFLEMSVKYAKELKVPPGTLPSGWAALLYLYNLR